MLQELPLYRTARFDSSLNKDIPSLGEWNDLLLRDAPASYVAIHELGTNLDRYPYPVWKTPNQQKVFKSHTYAPIMSKLLYELNILGC